MTVRHPLWYDNPPPTDEEVAAAWVGERPTVPGGRILVAEPDPGWPAVFEAERQCLIATLGNRALQVNHVGSTSVRAGCRHQSACLLTGGPRVATAPADARLAEEPRR